MELTQEIIDLANFICRCYAVPEDKMYDLIRMVAQVGIQNGIKFLENEIRTRGIAAQNGMVN